MKKTLALLSAATVFGSVSVAALPVYAGEEIIYGTMNIPYADFYRAEFQSSENAYEVDAVSSATTNKWKMNGEGQLFEGSYNMENEDGSGKILGVTYPVAISQSDLDALGSDNYNFTKIDSEPQAYKNVTVTDGKAEFSVVQDETPTEFAGTVKLSTSTGYGDYLLTFENTPEDMGAIYGAIVKTTNGNRYAMRHEENIWRGELAWSSGIRTTEVHGNALSYENYESMMGETIDEVTFITMNGYYNVATNTYIPLKFADSEVVAENGTAGTSSTSLSIKGFPDDYAKSYYIADNFTVTDNQISYTDALAGSYTLTISDKTGKYADATASFILSTDVMPAVYENDKIVKATDASEEEYANFMKNISTVSVNGTNYSAGGKRGVKIITEDGSIDFSAESRDGAVFDGTGNYEIVVTATGYEKALNIKIEPKSEEEPTTTTTVNTEETTNTTTTTTVTTAVATTTKNETKSTSATTANNQVANPKTGSSDMIPATIAVSAFVLVSAVASKKKKNEDLF